MITRKKIGIAVLVLLCIGALLFKFRDPFKATLGRLQKRDGYLHDDAKKERYYCPMHPTYVSDKPGDCPLCHMKLVPVSQGTSDKGSMKDRLMSTQTGAPAQPGGLGSVSISPQKQQLIGVTTDEAKVRPLNKIIRTTGLVAMDERRITEVYPKVGGWAEKVYVNATWQHVHKGEPLLEIYSPELVQTQEEYLLALRTRNALSESPFKEISQGGSSLLEAARRRLLLWDITEEQIRALEARGQAQKTMTLYAPAEGHVTQRDVFPSKRIEPNMKLYTIVDHSVVWVNVDIYENEIPFLKVGQNVQMTATAFPGEVFRGKVTLIWPHMEEKTRTVKARLEFANPRLLLKPEMYTNVEVNVPLGRQLAVPEDAVFNTGAQQYVFVDKGEGYFEPREVKLGAQADGYYAIKQGLRAGERVATAANFLLDSESRLRSAFANMGPPQKAAPGAEPAAESLRITLHTEPEPAKVGDNTVRVKVIDAQGSPISDASVRVTISMPAMGSMPPMSSEAQLSPKGNGEYSGVLNIPMAWTWQAVVTVERSGQRLGTYQSNISAK